MEPVRPLHAIFASLTGSADPSDALQAAGHEGLSNGLVTEAIISYADTAPVEVAEHLSPFVVAHSAVPSAGSETAWGDPDAAQGLHLLATAPAVPDHPTDETHHDLDGGQHVLDDHGHGGEPALIDHGDPGVDSHPDPHSHDPHHADDLQFGHGQAQFLDAGGQAQHPGTDGALTDHDDPHGWLQEASFDQVQTVPAHDDTHLEDTHLDPHLDDAPLHDGSVPVEDHGATDHTLDGPHGA
jgi:hypothetical protein